MKEKGRTYTELKKAMTEESFNNYCKRIATQYATSDGRFSSTYFTKAENIKSSCFYKLLRDAVIKNLVDDKIVDKMEEKAVFNQKRHYSEAGISSLIHYSELRQKRIEYIISTFSEEQIKGITETYANNPEKTMEEIANTNKISITVLKNILKKAFVESIVDMDICMRIEKRSMQNARNQEQKEKAFKKMWIQRATEKSSK